MRESAVWVDAARWLQSQGLGLQCFLTFYTDPFDSELLMQPLITMYASYFCLKKKNSLRWTFVTECFRCLQVSTPAGTLSHYFNLHVVVPKANIVGNGDYHVGEGSTITLLCMIQYVSKLQQLFQF